MRRIEITPQTVDAAMAQLPFSYDELNDIVHVGSTSQRDPLTGDFILKRPLNDIDLVMNEERQAQLVTRQPDLWWPVVHSFTQDDGSLLEIQSLLGFPDEDGIPLMDVWAQWYDPAGKKGNRDISPERLRKRSIRQKMGYHALHIDAAIVLNERFGRPQRLDDTAVLRQHSQYL